MTICIAALAGKEHVIVASDRMVTINIPSTEFEQGTSKTIPITDNCVAATAGSALAYTSIHREAQIEILRENTKQISRIGEITRLAYVKMRTQKLEQDILAKIGLTLQQFYQLNRSLAPEIIANAVQAMSDYPYNLSIVIAGVDSSSSHIYRIDNPGRIETFDSIGHCAVGSGELHALSTFVANDYTPDLDLDHVVALTYEAKKRSEKAQGVGQKTDLCIICQDGTIKLTQEQIAKLDEIYKKREQEEKKAVSEIQELITKLNMADIDKNTRNKN